MCYFQKQPGPLSSSPPFTQLLSFIFSPFCSFLDSSPPISELLVEEILECNRFQLMPSPSWSLGAGNSLSSLRNGAPGSTVADSYVWLKLTHFVCQKLELRIILIQLLSCSLSDIGIIAIMFLFRIFFLRVNISSFSAFPDSNTICHSTEELSLDRL